MLSSFDVRFAHKRFVPRRENLEAKLVKHLEQSYCGMGISLSCPLATYNDLESGLESIVVKSLCLGDDEVKTPERSISFKGQGDSEPMIVRKTLGSGKMIVEGSISFKQTEMDTIISINAPCITIDKEDDGAQSQSQSQSPSTQDLASPKHKAAVKLQKVYKSFRTRRKLADCAVLVEQSWWKLLDFAELKRSSISFFDIEQHETAISRWSRAKTRAAKVGKGLSKNEKAQKLALQHWLEAIDPRHRYGHNLHFYYVKWLESQSREPFFYWLDIGEGKEVNLVEKCPRCKLQQQCIKYLGPMERKAYEVSVEDGKLRYKESGEVLDTSVDPDAKWIFVLSTSKTLYVGKKQKGTFQHSSFLAGGATSAAGRLVVANGILKAVWPHSGHYRPTPENFQEFVSFLRENNVGLTDVKMDPMDEDEQSLHKQRSSLRLRNNSSEEEMAPDSVVGNDAEQKLDVLEQETAAIQDNSSCGPCLHLDGKLTHLQIPSRDELIAIMQGENVVSEPSLDNLDMDDGYDSATEAASSSEQEDDQVEKEKNIPAESILQRINSHKETKSYQLGKQLSCKWTTGAGPRIGCVRDYPSELQFRALEQVNLSPRCSLGAQIIPVLSPGCRPGSSPKTPMAMAIVSSTSVGQYRAQLSSLSKGTNLPL